MATKKTEKDKKKAATKKTTRTAAAKTTKTVEAPAKKRVEAKKVNTEEEVANRAEGPRAKKSENKTLPIVALCVSGVAILMSGTAFGVMAYNAVNGRSLGFNFLDSNSANFTEGSIADIANKVSPSVVSIVTETRTSSYYGQSSTASAAGTGMIISKDGYVLTNKHVVDSANKVSVVLDNGETYNNVTIIGTDPLNDVAVLKINGVDNLTPVKLGDSKTLNVGQQVIAIGNALGQYQNSVTEGIISGVGRNITAGDSSSSYYENLSDMIQTDAQINSGNSGGPLVNAAGEVIGINTALSTSGSSGNSISFAIPISSVKGIIKSVIETGELKRAYIGVAYVSLSPTVAKTYNLDVNYGAYLASSDSIIVGSPAEKAGLKSGDIITKVNGIEIGKSGSLSTLIGEHSVGESVDLTVVRDGKEINVRMTLVAYEEQNTKSVRTVRQ